MMNNEPNTDLVDKAIIYAVNHHKDIFRREKRVPYVVHPMEAMAIVASITEDNELIAAAALHDLIEDTDVTYEDLKKEFGDRIADIVLNESNNSFPNYKSLSWVETRQIGIDRLKNANLDCKIVALGDKLSNMRAIRTDFKTCGNEFWLKFHETDPKLHKWRYTELTKCFSGLEETDAYIEFKNLVEEVFKGI